MPQIVQFEKPPAGMADLDGFITTETAQDILRSIGLVRSINGPAITMISGAPGIGKTETMMHYCRENPDSALYISIAKGEGNPYHVATSVLSLFCPYQKFGTDLTMIRKRVGDHIGASRILLVDEAQNLTCRASRQLRSTHMIYRKTVATDPLVTNELPVTRKRLRMNQHFPA